MSIVRSFAMMTLFLLTVLLTGLEAGELDRVYDFLEKNARNRLMVQESEGTLDGGKAAYVFRRESVLLNLIRTKNSFSYDTISIIKQKIWDLKDGQKVGEPRDQDRWLAIRYEFSQRESTGEVLGTILSLAPTKSGASLGGIRLKLEGDQLQEESNTCLYNDFFAAGGTFYPGAAVTKTVWSVQDGKLVRETATKAFRVNPQTLEREFVQDLTTRDREEGKLPYKPE